MPKLIPASIWNALTLAIARGDTGQVKHLVEDNNLDVNAFFDSSSWMPVLMEALLSYNLSEEERLPLLRYLLEKGANPNICSHRGYNCLHIAVQQEKYIKALDLFLDFDADVNIGDADGSNIVYWAIQGWLLRKGGDDRPEHLRVLGKILNRGANLDQENNFGMTARKWLEQAAPDVKERIARWEEGRPVIQKVTTIQAVFPTNGKNPELAHKLWNEFEPPVGPATTLQGKLLRSIRRLFLIKPDPRQQDPYHDAGNKET